MSRTEKRTRKKMKPGPRTYLIGFGLLVVIAAAIFAGVLHDTAPVDAASEDTVLFQVSQGENANQITAKLKEQGLIKNELAFKYYLKSHHVSSKLRAGSYQPSPAMDTAISAWKWRTGKPALSSN